MSFPRAHLGSSWGRAVVLCALVTATGCAGSAFPSYDAGLGESGTGGSSSEGAGGSQSTGGETAATGGETAATGGETAASGGSHTTGGSRALGGSHATGGAKSTGGAPATGGAKSTGGASATSAPTWTQLYTNYFAAGTPGDCASSGCHGGRQSPTFNSASTMCSTMKSIGIIGSGTASFNTLLKWFKQGGSMPQNGNATPANAVADITAWQSAGAVCP